MVLESTSVTDHASYRPLACMFSIVIFMNNVPCIEGIKCVISHCTTPLMPTHDLCTHWNPLHLLAPTQFPPMPACTFIPACTCFSLHAHLFSHALHTACVNLFGKFTQWIYWVNLLRKFGRQNTPWIYLVKCSANLLGEMNQENYSGNLLSEICSKCIQQIYSPNLLSKILSKFPYLISLSNLLSEILSKFTWQNT